MARQFTPSGELDVESPSLLDGAPQTELFGKQIYNSGPIQCAINNIDVKQTIIPITETIRVKRSLIWAGFDYWTICDFAAQVYRLGDENIINACGLDKYTHLAGPHQWPMENNILIPAGDGIVIDHFANAFPTADKKAAKTPNYHVVVWLWHEHQIK